ncbi:CHAP domain-containing protein [Longispora sp. NPDC051575]|uniref:CHAP domain-containing protein n=1 Tax=Longispora sp. NPDC051575 TaxID=3154943 RepID=UPI003439CFEE
MFIKKAAALALGLALAAGGVVALSVTASAAPTGTESMGEAFTGPAEEPTLDAAGPGPVNLIRYNLAKAAVHEYNLKITEANRKCDKYLTKSEGQNCAKTAWCGAFTRYIWKTNATSKARIPGSPLWATNWGFAGNNAPLFQLRGSGKGGTPNLGDVVVYGRPGASGHVSIVVKVHPNGNIDTVDGNASNKVHYKKNLDPRTAVAGENGNQHIWGYRKPA